MKEMRMTTEYNASEIDRLVREGTEDNERMTPGPWSVDSHTAEVWAGLDADDHLRDVIDPHSALLSDAAAIARTRNNLRAMVAALSAAKAEVERLTDERDELKGRAWASFCDCIAAQRDEARRDRDRLAAEVERLSQDGPVWLRFALQCIHSQVDRTDPNDPVGAALTRAGLERLGADYGPEHVDHVAQVTALAAEVERLTAERDEAVAKSERYLSDGKMLHREIESVALTLNEIGWPSENAPATARARRAIGELAASRDRLSARVREQDEQIAHLVENAGRDSCADFAQRCNARVRELESAAKDHTTLPTDLVDRIVAKAEGRCLGTIGDGFVVCGEGGNYCSEACRLRARVRELELTKEDREALRQAKACLGPAIVNPIGSCERNHNDALALLDRLVKGGR